MISWHTSPYKFTCSFQSFGPRVTSAATVVVGIPNNCLSVLKPASCSNVRLQVDDSGLVTAVGVRTPMGVGQIVKCRCNHSTGDPPQFCGNSISDLGILFGRFSSELPLVWELLNSCVLPDRQGPCFEWMAKRCTGVIGHSDQCWTREIKREPSPPT